MKKLWLAGGCFWGVEAYFHQLKGVLQTRVGYGQGQKENPTYPEVCSGTTGHTEICEIIYDEEKLSLVKVLEHFFRIIDPTTINGQGPDRGTQYRTGIYYTNEEEKEVILTYVQGVQTAYTKEIVVEIEPLTSFYLAEEYHQQYLEKTKGGYCHINLMLAQAEERK